MFRYGRRKMSLAQRMDSVRQKKDAFRRKMEQEDEWNSSLWNERSMQIYFEFWLFILIQYLNLTINTSKLKIFD